MKRIVANLSNGYTLLSPSYIDEDDLPLFNYPGGTIKDFTVLDEMMKLYNIELTDLDSWNTVKDE